MKNKILLAVFLAFAVSCAGPDFKAGEEKSCEGEKCKDLPGGDNKQADGDSKADEGSDKAGGEVDPKTLGGLDSKTALPNQPNENPPISQPSTNPPQNPNNPVTQPQSLACQLDGKVLQHGESEYFYSTQSSSNCLSSRASRTCANGQLSGALAYQYLKCDAPTTCSIGGLTLTNGQSQTFYSASSSSNCASLQQTRTCTNGTMSGSSSHIYADCGTPTIPTAQQPVGGSLPQYTWQSVTTQGAIGISGNGCIHYKAVAGKACTTVGQQCAASVSSWLVCR